MPSSIDEFRQRIYKPEEIVLPSGLCARIRKVFARDFLGMGELPVPRGGPDGAAHAIPPDRETLANRRYSDRALVKGVVSPKLTDAYDDGGEPVMVPERLHVSELEEEDYNALCLAITQWCGLTQEDGQAVEAFRPDTQWALGESVSPGIPLSAE